MAGPYGVQPSGFVLKPLDAIKAELEDDFRGTFGAGINLTPQSNFGQVVGIMSERFAELWQLAEAVYNATSPDGAEGVSQDFILSLTGTARKPPTLTHVVARCAGTPGTVLAKGRVASVVGTGDKFESVADATIGGDGAVAVEFVAQSAGPRPAYAGTLTAIETPVAGWAAITNPADHYILGTNLEADPEARVRRELELRAQGNAAIEPVRQKVLQVRQVLDCFVFENDTDTGNADGLPPHSIEVIVDGGADAEIRKAIFGAKSAGIATYGSVTAPLTDSQGITRAISFSRPVFLDAWIKLVVTRDPSKFPADGVDEIRKAIADYGARHYTVGSNVIGSALVPEAFKTSGVIDVAPPLIGLANPPTSSANLITSLREKPRLDFSRVIVVLA